MHRTAQVAIVVMIEMWGAGTARTLRPLWMAEELGLPYHLEPIGPRTGETQTPAFTALNWKQKIPVIRDGDISLSESLAICRYLQHTYPSAALAIPDTTIARAKEDEWCCYIYGELDETSLYVLRRHFDLTDVYGEAPQAVRVCRTYLQRHFTMIDAYLDGRATVLDSGFGLADIMLVSCVDWAVFYGESMPAQIAAYRDKIAARPAYRKAMAVNYKSLIEMAHGTS